MLNFEDREKLHEAARLLNTAMRWCATSEGDSYWREVRDRLEEIADGRPLSVHSKYGSVRKAESSGRYYSPDTHTGTTLSGTEETTKVETKIKF